MTGLEYAIAGLLFMGVFFYAAGLWASCGSPTPRRGCTR